MNATFPILILDPFGQGETEFNLAIVSRIHKRTRNLHSQNHMTWETFNVALVIYLFFRCVCGCAYFACVIINQTKLTIATQSIRWWKFI